MAADDRWWGLRARLQVSTWRDEGDTIVLSPVPHRPSPTADDVRRELEGLRERGIRRALTGALHEGELGPFIEAGFHEHERLHLLRHDLVVLPDPVEGVRHRRAWRRDHPAILDIDGRAFEPFWALDQRGLEDAIRATPSSRVRVALGSDGIAGYAVSGRAGDRGYLQRLAVDPDRHRSGIGRTLVADALRWLRRTGSRVVAVNTQERNSGALELYLATGFVLEPHGLTVLAHDLSTGSAS